MKKDVAASAAGAEIYLAIPHIANALKEELKDIPTVANFATVHRPIDNLQPIGYIVGGRMLQIKKTEYFSKWHANLKDARARAKINLRIEQVKLGNFGEFKFVGEGIYEMRIHYGPGYRIYYTKKDDIVVLLLAGGDKSTQQKDIDKAKELNNEKK